MKKKRIRKVIKTSLLLIIIFTLIVFVVFIIKNITNNKVAKDSKENKTIIMNNDEDRENIDRGKVIDDWRLVLVNSENFLEEDFEVKLANIDSSRKFDARAIGELTQMLKDMKSEGISNIWPQSTYRSISKQTEIFNDKIELYMKNGNTREDAEKLTLQTINKPGTSEHNLGLAVDFNYVDYKFEKTKEYKWLKENAENYGFILRYAKDKEDITKVNFEPWHWRYVGKEHAQKINELDMCLEEYIDYLKND